MLLLAFQLCISIPLSAQVAHNPLRILNTKDGLPQSFVSGLLQDKDGFVWMGTRNGLARYDGRQFKKFQHNSKDPSTLQSNLILYIKPDKHNRIWIVYEGKSKIDCFDPATEVVTHISDTSLARKFPIRAFQDRIQPAADGSLWCTAGSNSISRYNWEQNQVEHFTVATDHLLQDSVFCLLEDHQNQMWVATRSAFSRLEPSTGKFIHFRYPAPFVINHFAVLHERKNGELIISNQEDLLLLFNPVTATFRTISLPYQPKNKILMQTGPDGKDYLEINGAVYRYNDGQGLTLLVNHNRSSVFSVESFLIDHSGMIWLGLNAGGIEQVDLFSPSFETHSYVHSFHYDLLKQELNLQLDAFSGYQLSNPYFRWSSYFFRSAYDKQQRLWIALGNRVGYYEAAQKKWVQLPALPVLLLKPTDFAESRVLSIAFAPDGRLWAVNDNQFVGYFDTTQQQWIPFLDTVALQKIGLFGPLTDMEADANHLWITSNLGLVQVDLRTRQVQRFNQKNRTGWLPSDVLLDLAADPKRPELLWIGSYEGLICLNKKAGTTTLFTTQNGLPDNTIYSIQADNAGFLWLSTNQGLCRFDPASHQVQNFKVENALQSNEFNRFFHLKLPDGRLAFGGMNGWLLFDPAAVRTDNYQPPVSFIALKIYNEPVTTASHKDLLPKALNDLQLLQLPYDRNTLSFEFAGLEYRQPAAIHYRYQLEGYDDKWITTDNPVASYTKLPFGYFTLKVQCSNATGQWSTQVKTLPIHILAPWWRSIWAYIGYVLLGVGTAWYFYHNWLQKTKAKQQLLLRQKEAEQLKAVDEMKSRFFSNITHEFRTPLSLIMAPAAQMQHEEPSLYWKEKINGIQRNASQLLQLINQLLDMAKLEADSMKLTLHRGHLYLFTQQLVQSFSPAATAKSVSLNFDSAIDEEEYLFDADKLQTILLNVVSNALKFTPAGGTIEVNLEAVSSNEEKTTFCFAVKDTGIGIAADKLPHIFNRFYQADDSTTRTYGGTGIGLALAKELAELMQGKLLVNSEKGQGATFTLWLPLAKANDETVPLFVQPQATTTIPTTAESDVAMEAADDKPLLLVVEDNEELNHFMVQAFKSRYRVLTATNGEEGLQIAQAELPDIIISDWMMPRMDGLSLCREIKAHLATSHIAFVLLTARSAPLSRIEGLQTGVDDYLTKPFLVEELELKVKNLLENQRRIREKWQLQMSQPTAAIAAVPDAESSLNPQQAAFIQKLYEIIELHLDDTAFGVEELAAGVAMSRTNLHRKVKALVGLPAGDIIRNYRLKRAISFLQEGYNSTETTYKVGFDSLSYFIKCFREMYGATPQDYIQKQP